MGRPDPFIVSVTEHVLIQALDHVLRKLFPSDESDNHTDYRHIRTSAATNSPGASAFGIVSLSYISQRLLAVTHSEFKVRRSNI